MRISTKGRYGARAMVTLACRYDELLADLPVQTPGVAEHQRHAFNYYTIRAPRRDELRGHLTDHQIGTSVFYPLPLHLQPCFAALGTSLAGTGRTCCPHSGEP